MKILAFNTTHSRLGVALFENKKLLAEFDEESQNQAEFLLPKIEEILKSQNIWYQDLSAIATTNGPASFTGVRIGLTAAKMMKFATNLPLLAFDSLEILAYDFLQKSNKKPQKITAIIDAKMDEFFVRQFVAEDNKLKALEDSILVKFEDLKHLKIDKNHTIIGSGKEILGEIFKEAQISNIDEKISAATIAKMAVNSTQNEDLNPRYLRLPKITERKN